MDSLSWLQDWYYHQCDDRWEHEHSISIQTLANPGWLINIDLSGTPLESEVMTEIGEVSEINHDGIKGKQDWIICKVENGMFVGAGGPCALFQICDVFRDWVETVTSTKN